MRLERLRQFFTLYIVLLCVQLRATTPVEPLLLKRLQNAAKICAVSAIASLAFQPTPAAVSSINMQRSIRNLESKYGLVQSRGWELARQKRTAAIREMQSKGIIKVDTDDSGNQFLSLPWIPDRRLPYKSLSVRQRLTNEVCAGAFGEIAKDTLLYSVDTMKTRRQAKKPSIRDSTILTSENITYTPNNDNLSTSYGANVQGSGALVMQNVAASNTLVSTVITAVQSFPTLYAGFPIVAIASIPQGGVFFLVKKGLVELFARNSASVPAVVADTVPITLGVMAYWLFRTPAEVIKTQVQTGQVSSVASALHDVLTPTDSNSDSNGTSTGVASLYLRYPVMLSLDIPFQLINFVLYGWLSELLFTAPAGLHWEQNIGTRLLCGITCGVVAAAVTCPLDVCKTRIIARERARCEAYVTSLPSANVSNGTDIANGTDTMLDSMETTSMAEEISENHTPVTQSLPPTSTAALKVDTNNNMLQELHSIATTEGVGTLFLGFGQRLLYTGLANGIRLSAYGTSRMDLMMRSLDRL